VKKKSRSQPWQWCNVVREGEAERHLWQFRPRGTACQLIREHSAVGAERLPAKVGGKDFQTLFQPKLNIAWLPPGEVFLSVVVLPTSDPAELKDMLELQLEKLSPLPAAQTAWTFLPLPGGDGNQSRVLLVVVPRHAIAAFLGRLEAEGYLADRLDLSQIDELLTCLAGGDGVWVLPRRIRDRLFAVIAWVIDGKAHHVGLTLLPETNWQEVIKTQFAQVVWAGELDGWLHQQPAARLVAEPGLAAEFEPVLRELTGQPVEQVEPLAEPELARLTADRSRQEQLVPLLPPDVAARYRQTFVDRIWMRSLGAVVLLYLFGVLGYFAGIEWARQQQDAAKASYQSVARRYTNTVELAQRVKILQNQMSLKYAALDTFKAVAEKLPEGMALTSFSFQRGTKVLLFGTAPQNEPAKITAFVGSLQSAEADGRRLFSAITSPTIRVDPANAQTRWSFDCVLANPELQR